ncbi:MAG TPA: hypothetical protein VFX70_14420 [Mycobacteriales bacterium]|nr:hypothetical protein [Mycobacteriales bacterium]
MQIVAQQDGRPLYIRYTALSRSKVMPRMVKGLSRRRVALGDVARHGGPVGYRAAAVDEAAWVARQQPKVLAVQRSPRLRDQGVEFPQVTTTGTTSSHVSPTMGSP